jgi:hypothetical protein
MTYGKGVDNGLINGNTIVMRLGDFEEELTRLTRLAHTGGCSRTAMAAILENAKLDLLAEQFEIEMENRGPPEPPKPPPKLKCKRTAKVYVLDAHPKG